MGRVYDALRRAKSAEENGTGAQKKSKATERLNGAAFNPAARSVIAESVEEHPWDRSTLFTATAERDAHTSAPTAHTDAPNGSALPAGQALRDAGATLGAAGSERTAEFPAQEISAARVEPHLVAITQPHSPYCEQFRALRTSILHTAE